MRLYLKSYFTILMLITFFSCSKNNIKPDDKAPPGSDVFDIVAHTGEQSIDFFRIPTIIQTPDKCIMAFMEGRINGMNDFGKINIVAKKSKDNGKTWSKLIFVAKNGNMVAGNPVPVVDYTDPLYPNGRLLLFYCTGNNDATNILNLIGVREVWYVSSIDNGVTWSAPVNITLQVHHPFQPQFNAAYDDPLKWSNYATGPCHAIQLTRGRYAGRLVIPFNHGIFATKSIYAAVFYTDDHCKTFHISPDVTLESDESTVAELENGGVILNSRNQYLGTHHRIISYDYSGKLDTSTHWGSAFNTELPEPACEASMLSYTTQSNNKTLLFSNPSNPDSRTILGIRQSFDEGKTWTGQYIINQQFGAYSDIVALANGEVGLIYEADNYTKIRFVSFDYNLIPQE